MLRSIQEPRRVLCLHDLSGAGRCSLGVILPVLAAMGCQPVALPTAVLSTHTGGLGEPARMEDAAYPLAALEHYAALGLDFACIYTGYLATPAQAQAAQRAFALWPKALKLVDPVLGDDGRRYRALPAEMVDEAAGLARRADLIVPNLTEACLLLGLPQPDQPDLAAAQAMAEGLLALAPAAVITGLPLGKDMACVGAVRDRESFVQRSPHLGRRYPGTGDLFAAVLAGALLRGNALSAAVDAAAGFVGAAIQATAPDADPRLGVWFEPLLGRLAARD